MTVLDPRRLAIRQISCAFAIGRAFTAGAPLPCASTRPERNERPSKQETRRGLGHRLVGRGHAVERRDRAHEGAEAAEVMHLRRSFFRSG